MDEFHDLDGRESRKPTFVPKFQKNYGRSQFWFILETKINHVLKCSRKVTNTVRQWNHIYCLSCLHIQDTLKGNNDFLVELNCMNAYIFSMSDALTSSESIH